MKKKVFSLSKYILDCHAIGLGDDVIGVSVAAWAKNCEGLIQQDIQSLDLITSDDWFIQVDFDA